MSLVKKGVSDMWRLDARVDTVGLVKADADPARMARAIVLENFMIALVRWMTKYLVVCVPARMLVSKYRVVRDDKNNS